MQKNLIKVIQGASYGNNHYSVSNLHQWLNSKKTSWYSPMHSLDAPPITENVIGTEYESEKGFLTNFSSNFLAKVKNTTFKTALHSLDGEGLETTVAKFFVPSCAEVGFGNENGLSEGKIFSLFSDSSNLNATFEGSAIGYYLRTPATTNNEYDYRIVRDTGSKYTNTACNAKVGTRVVCNIDANIEVENKTSYYKLKLSNYLNENTSLSSALGVLENKKETIKGLKENLYNSLIEKGTDASSGDTLEALISKVSSINTGKKWASGLVVSSTTSIKFNYPGGYTDSYGFITISKTNIGFTPKLIIAINRYVGTAAGGYDYYSIYDGYSTIYANGVVRSAPFLNNSYGDVYTHTFKADDKIITTDNYIIPVAPYSCNFEWYAFE